LRSGDYEKARERAQWNQRVVKAWNRVRIVETSQAPVGAVMSGRPIQVRAAVDLAGLKPTDVRVEAVLGRVGPTGALEDTEVIVLPASEESEPVTVFAREITPRHTGRLGYALRVSPNHYEDPLTRPCPDLLRWG
jgi:starch phosphorylase